jgi:hypothetical protein
VGQEKEIKSMNKEFSYLSEENKKRVLDMTKFLVLTQNSIVPAILQKKQQGVCRNNCG